MRRLNRRVEVDGEPWRASRPTRWPSSGLLRAARGRGEGGPTAAGRRGPASPPISGPSGATLLGLTGRHLLLVAVSLAAAIALAVPLGLGARARAPGAPRR